MSKTLAGKKKITSVWLEAEKTHGKDKLKMFFCPNCRVPIVQYQGQIIRIVPGNHPYSPKTVIKCKGRVPRTFDYEGKPETWEECGMYYSFMGVVENSEDKI